MKMKMTLKSKGFKMNYFDGAEELFQQRSNEINKFINQCKLIQDQQFMTPNEKREFTRVVKSNVVLMQYNLIESVFLELFVEFYQILKNSKLGIDDLSSRFFYNLLLLIRRMPDKNLKIIQDSIDNSSSSDIRLSNLILKAGFELTEEEKKFLVNGNLDGRKVKEFLQDWGFDIHAIDSLDVSCLRTLKDQRQLLAHGGNSFSDQGRSITWENIDSYKQAIDKLFIATKKLLTDFFLDNSIL